MSIEDPTRTSCRKCNGTGVDGGRWHYGDDCAPEFEPYRCIVCDGSGTDQVDEDGISHGMIQCMLDVVIEGLRTGSTDLRSLMYCAYREARKLDVPQQGGEL